MEWPELVEDILPEETVRVRISVGENEERTLSVS
jgi:tRNA A37 threonylcarbamoyladenosine biosynthesis protein TsaE